ncbi:peptide deformylase [bacterium]|nr:peptide deformylase [bacterium]
MHLYTLVPPDHAALHEVAREIPLSDIASPHIQNLIHQMRTLLRAEKNGVALAAPQVGEPLRLFVVAGHVADARKRKDSEELVDMPTEDEVYINPVLLKTSREKKKLHEGCLSLKGYWGEVPRSLKATVRAYNEQGKECTRGASGLLAHIFQHEMDHLEGILYTEKATKLYEEREEHEHE